MNNFKPNNITEITNVKGYMNFLKMKVFKILHKSKSKSNQNQFELIKILIKFKFIKLINKSICSFFFKFIKF